MGLNSHIEWTEATWNPVTGCTKISAGCKHCYAERMAKRLKAMGVEQYKDGFKLTLQPKTLELPYKWKKGKVIFVNSMSDLFHKNVPDSYIEQVFQVMNDCTQHHFQVLTKRPERAASIAKKLNWTKNIWMGTSVENTDTQHRIHSLQKIPANIRFLSLEPLLGPLPRIPLARINWVIVGGESGPGAREMKKEWVVQIKDQCIKKNVAFFFKQWGGVQKSKHGRELDGQIYDELPVLQVS